MLIMFRVKNFASFRDEAILDMRSASYKQHPDHIISINSEMSLLKTVAIYGANAAGKSNFLRAMHFFQEYILGQFYSRLGKSFSSDDKVEPFRLLTENDERTEFEIVFLSFGSVYQYGFTILDDAVQTEWYYIDDKKVFERELDKVSVAKSHLKSLSALKNTAPEKRLFLAVMENLLNKDIKMEILGGFIRFLNREFVSDSSFSIEFAIKRIIDPIEVFAYIEEDEKLRSKVLDETIKVDSTLSQLVVKDIDMDMSNNKVEKRKFIEASHKRYSKTGEYIDSISFPMSMESSGTRRFMHHMELIIPLLEKGGVFIVDEISSHLHPLLVKQIVDMFQDKANSNSQLIFTTHDTALLNREQFRRDEIVFVDRNCKGESSLYSLSDLKVREDSSFAKDYLSGKYGAIPFLNDNDIDYGE